LGKRQVVRSRSGADKLIPLVLTFAVITIVARRILRQQSLPPRFVQHRHTQLAGFVELEARLFASHHIGGFLEDGTADLAVDDLDQGLGLFVAGVLSFVYSFGSTHDVELFSSAPTCNHSSVRWLAEQHALEAPEKRGTANKQKPKGSRQ
jgi:hypothetical protein